MMMQIAKAALFIFHSINLSYLEEINKHKQWDMIKLIYTTAITKSIIGVLPEGSKY